MWRHLLRHLDRFDPWNGNNALTPPVGKLEFKLFESCLINVYIHFRRPVVVRVHLHQSGASAYICTCACEFQCDCLSVGIYIGLRFLKGKIC